MAAANDADTSGYTTLQKKAAEIIAGSGAIAQFLDRDTRPDFAGPNGMQGFLQTFLTDPDQDLDAYLGTHPGRSGTFRLRRLTYERR